MTLALQPLTSSRIWDLNQLLRSLNLSTRDLEVKSRKKKKVLTFLGCAKRNFSPSFFLEVFDVAKEVQGNLPLPKAETYISRDIIFLRMAPVFHIILFTENRAVAGNPE